MAGPIDGPLFAEKSVGLLRELPHEPVSIAGQIHCVLGLMLRLGTLVVVLTCGMEEQIVVACLVIAQESVESCQ